MYSICEHTGLKILQKKEWNYYSPYDNYSQFIKIIDDNILHIKVSGSVLGKSYFEGMKIYEDVINKYFYKKEFFVVHDYSDLAYSSLRVRQHYTNWILQYITNIPIIIFYNVNFIVKTYIVSSKLLSSRFSKVQILSDYKNSIDAVINYKKNKINNLQEYVSDKVIKLNFNFSYIKLIEKNIWEIKLGKHLNNQVINNLVDIFYIIQDKISEKVFLIIDLENVVDVDIKLNVLQYKYLNLEIASFNIRDNFNIEITDKLNKIFKVNYFNNKEKAIDVFKEKTYIETKTVINPLFEKLWNKNKNFFFLKNTKYPALKPKEWSYSVRDGAVKHYTFLVDEDIYYRNVSGYLEKNDISYLIGSIDKIFEESRPKDMKYYLIMDYNDLRGVSLQNRKEGVEWFKSIINDAHYVVFCNLSYMLKVIVRYAKTKLGKNVIIVDTVEDAFDFVLNKKYNKTKTKVKTITFQKKTKKETIKELKQENYKLKQDLYSNIEKLKEIFGKITWEEELNISDFDYKSNNPFSELFMSAYLLQKDIKEIIENRETLVKQAEKSEKLKTAFLANISHEIRTPLNAILGFSEILQEQLSNPETDRYFDIINKNGEHLLNLINQIIDYSRITSGDVELNYSVFELNLLIKEIILSFMINEKDIELIFDVDINKEVYIKSDRIRLKQVLTNLISNAVKFTDKGYIKVSYKINNDKINFIVEDTGIGISEDNLNIIFNRFQQAEGNMQSKYGGTGLGLSISKEIINLLGGEISAESEINKGSKFYFSIEYIKQNKQEQTIVSPEYKTNLSNKTILIVDDIEDNLFFIKEILVKLDVNILTADNGKDAVKIAIDKNPDLILMDILLPDIDGFAASKAILSKNPKAKIIIQSAYISDEEKNYAKEINCVDFLTKPIKKNILISTIKKYL